MSLESRVRRLEQENGVCDWSTLRPADVPADKWEAIGHCAVPAR